jgi:hypothetical protein
LFSSDDLQALFITWVLGNAAAPEALTMAVARSGAVMA